MPELLFYQFCQLGPDEIYMATKAAENSSREEKLNHVEPARLTPHISAGQEVVGISGQREETYFLQSVEGRQIIYSVPWQDMASQGEPQEILRGRSELMDELDLPGDQVYSTYDLIGPVKGSENLYQAGGNKLAALDPDTGEVNWEFEAKSNLVASFLGLGVLYFAPAENLTALDLDEGEVIRSKDHITYVEKDEENPCLYLSTRSEILKVESDTGELKDTFTLI